MEDSEKNRRPIAARSAAWAQHLAAYLAHTDVSPNQVSAASVAFAAIGAGLLLSGHHWAAYLGAAIAIQFRLVCNLIDGMVAVEGGKKSALGQLYNEFPDRIADSLLIVALGYAADTPAWGWFAALAAALTAYVRVFGGAIGLTQDFRGPMAKQHRMAVMTGACLLEIVEQGFYGSDNVLKAAVAVIGVGAILTCVTRTRGIAAQLKGRGT